MKNIISTLLIALCFTSASGQIYTNSTPASAIANSNAFLDASSNYSSAGFESNDRHKGLVFPDVNLSTFQFENIVADGITFPSFYDGMVVYNTSTGSTLTTGIRPSTSIAVSPGFYYFSNPNGAANGNVTSGVWTPLGSGSVKNISATETTTSTSIDGKQVYALTGTFTADTAPTVLVPNPTYVSTAVVSITKPTGFTGYFKMTTYTTDLLGVKKTFRSDVSSLTVDPLDANKLILVTGNGLFSEVYPGGTYTYILEFFKA